MTAASTLADSDIFVDPYIFNPERWLGPEEQVAVLKRSFVPFARGNRMCLGMHFALAQLYTLTATIFRRYEFELYDTIRSRDVDHSWSHLIGEPSKGSMGVRFRVTDNLAEKV